jgi:hypothetical protein
MRAWLDCGDGLAAAAAKISWLQALASTILPHDGEALGPIISAITGASLPTLPAIQSVPT